MKSSADVAIAPPERPMGRSASVQTPPVKRASGRSTVDSKAGLTTSSIPNSTTPSNRHSIPSTKTLPTSDDMPTKTTSKAATSAKKTGAPAPAAKKSISKETSSVPDWSALEERGQAFYRRNEVNLSADLEYAAYKIAVDVAFALSEEVEEFDGFSSSFRRGLQWAARRALNCVFESSRSIVVLPEALPGYTLLAFKKVGRASAMPAGESAPHEPESLSTLDVVAQTQAAALMIDRYMSAMSNARVMAIESTDVLLALFPTQDTRRNLQDMVLSMREDPLED